jgi:predicted DNA-binding transcriptional regulator YafY
MSGAELARRLEIDRRTVRRYVSMLEDMGIPITAERGRDGAYGLVSGFKLPPMMFTDDEALALSIGLLAARGLGLAGASPAIASAQAKLERVMPAKLKRRVRAVDETVTLEAAPPDSPVDNGALAELSGAAQSLTRVRMRYRARQGEESERAFDPYGLAYRSGRWYVVGMCHLRKGVRSFRLDRVHSVQSLNESFTRPAKFDALAHLTNSLATIPRAFAVEVLLRTDLEAARRHVYPTVGVLESTADGVLLRAQVDNLAWFARELARLPFEFDVHAPAQLRDELDAVAHRLLERVRS